MERLTREARQVLELARDEARRLRQRKVRTEHLLLGLLHSEKGPGARVLRERGLTLEEARATVERITGRGDRELWAELIPFAGRSKRTLEVAAHEAKFLGQDRIGPEHILLGLLRGDEGGAAQVLAAFGVDYAQVRAAVIRGPYGWHRRGDVKLAVACVGVFAVGVLVGRAFRAH